MKDTRFVIGIIVALVLLSACTSAPTSAPQVVATSTTVSSVASTVPTKVAATPAPTVTPTAVTATKSVLEIKPVQPVGGLELLYAGTTAKVYFDHGLEAAYNSGFRTMTPQQFIDLVENQLTQIKNWYPGVKQGIEMAQNEASVFAYDSWAEYYQELKNSGQLKYMTPEMLEQDRQEIFTVGKAFALARVYMRLKLVDWAATISRGMTGSLNILPLIFVNPAVLCDSANGSHTLNFICGMESGKFSKPL